jgi:predicted hydrocarbon binding protein
VAPILPLALLEAVRLHDRPREVLEDEDLSISLPRRLGLTGVVESQIQRYEDARRRGEWISADEVGDLLRLVLRRPDAEAILREAGGQVARQSFRRGPAIAATALRVLPRSALFAATRRAARQVLRRMAAGARRKLYGRPPVVRLANSLSVRVDASGTACALYAGTIEELVALYTRWRPQVIHSLCGARGDTACEWTLADPAVADAPQPDN